ncbi:elicitor-responsive protein 1 isoform X2 [Abrus precatorius]|uniref:Elicitor-responsive protein 1 isoform X2 n=1 Tax=Abrus precatorius TaxID=3816 RepID=A0A8B8LX85_ABRPR|nr:elicitor-responsive protein 1 isoform X2 [Abrus precatorius]
MMSITGIQGQPLEVTVVSCSKLKDTEWISRQDPYVCVEYGSTKFRTRTCTDGGKNPVFQEKFVFPLIEGLRELNVFVWNSNTLTFDDFIGSGRIQLHKVLSQGFDDSAWPLQTKTGRHAGEVKLILHYAAQNQRKSNSVHPPSAPPPTAAPYLPTGSVSAYQGSYPPPSTLSYPPPPTAYPSSSPSPYSSHSPAYPPPSYPASSPYPPPSYPPPSAYPPPPYPPPAGYPPGIYPPPPY